MAMPTKFARIAALCLAAMACGPAPAQTYPDKPVTLVVPYAPGGATDQIARVLGLMLQEKWKQPVVVDNRPGASAVIGASLVMRARSDGYMLLISDSSTFVTVPHMMEQLPFNVQRDFAPITIVARQPAVLTTRKGFPGNSVKDLIDYAKANPGKVTYGSFGIGTWAHVGMEDFSKSAGIKMLHVPYRGGGLVLTDMMAERIDIFFATMGAVTQYKETGKLKVLAAATAKRIPSQPDLPTMAESGAPGFSLSLWFGIVAPSQTPAPVVRKIQKDIADLQHDPAFMEKALKAISLEPGGETPEEFASIMKVESEKWRRVIDDAGLRGSASK